MLDGVSPIGGGIRACGRVRLRLPMPHGACRAAISGRAQGVLRQARPYTTLFRSVSYFCYLLIQPPNGLAMASSTPEFIPETTQDDPVQFTTLDLQGRSHQISPVFNALELQRLQRYGTRHHFADGETLFEAGSSSFGMLGILSGRVSIKRHEVIQTCALPI